MIIINNSVKILELKNYDNILSVLVSLLIVKEKYIYYK